MKLKEQLKEWVEKNNPYQDRNGQYERQCFRRGASSLIPLVELLFEALVKTKKANYRYATAVLGDDTYVLSRIDLAAISDQALEQARKMIGVGNE